MAQPSSNISPHSVPPGTGDVPWTTCRNQGWVYTDLIVARDAGRRALDFYVERYRHSSRHVWAQRFAAGRIRLDEAVIDGETRLAAGACLAYHRPPWQEPAAPRDFVLLYDDGDVLAVAKPAGLQVLPAAEYLHNTLLSLVRERLAGHPAPVHRLGRGTSGIVLFARSRPARHGLSEALRTGGLRKTYRALVTGVHLPARFEIDQEIGRLDYPGLGHVYAAVDGGKASSSHVRVLEERRRERQTLVEVEIPTGRPHQIRIHLASAGYPLVGEPLYRTGGRPPAPDSSDLPLPGAIGYHLHALRVAFRHPTTSAAIRIECPPPPILNLGSL